MAAPAKEAANGADEQSPLARVAETAGRVAGKLASVISSLTGGGKKR